MCVCERACARARARLSNFRTTIIHKRPEISIRNLVQHRSSHAPSIVKIFMRIDAQSGILWDFEFFEDVRGSSKFRKIYAIVLKLHTNIIHRSRDFGIEFGQNRLKCSNFLRFRVFWKFSLKCVTCINFEILSSKFVYEYTNTKWCFIRNFVKIGL